jgi:hypothetical protein
MPQEDNCASKLKNSKVVGCLALPSNHDAAELLQPCEDSFELPASTIATEATSILLAAALVWPAPLWGYEFDFPLGAEALCELSAVEAFVRDEDRREVVGPGGVESVVEERDVMSRTIRDANGCWKTSAVCKRHDLCRIAGAAPADLESPLLAGA